MFVIDGLSSMPSRLQWKSNSTTNTKRWLSTNRKWLNLCSPVCRLSDIRPPFSYPSYAGRWLPPLIDRHDASLSRASHNKCEKISHFTFLRANDSMTITFLSKYVCLYVKLRTRRCNMMWKNRRRMAIETATTTDDDDNDSNSLYKNMTVNMRRVNECMCIGAWQIKSTRIIFSDFGFFLFRFFSIIATRSTSVMIWFSVVLCLCSPHRRVCVCGCVSLTYEFVIFATFAATIHWIFPIRLQRYDCMCITMYGVQYPMHRAQWQTRRWKWERNERKKKKNIGIEIDTHSNVSRIEWTTPHNE